MGFIPYVVTEREPGGWEDCVWATGVMHANLAVGENRYPATRDEYESLRFAATGVREAPGDGSNYGELERGLRARYHLPVIRRGSGWANAIENTPVGGMLDLQGLYSALPIGVRISSFRGGHSAPWYRDRVDSGLFLDPLLPNGGTPKRLSIDGARRYYEALSGAEWIAVYEREAYSQPMIVFNLERFYLAAGTPVYENPGGLVLTKISKGSTVTTIGQPMSHTAPGVLSGWRAVLITTAALDGISRMKIGFVKKPTQPPATTSPDWDAAVVKALLSPSFRGGDVIDATAAQIEAAHKAGLLDGLKAAESGVEKLITDAGG